MFSQASIVLSTWGMCVAGRRAWGEGAHAWQGCGRGMCMVGEMATAADGTHPTGMYSYKYRCVGLK